MSLRLKDEVVLDWLLEKNQPSVRYLALTQLLGRSERDDDVRSAKEMIPKSGWAAGILSKQHPEGWWVRGVSLYGPEYISTNWMLLILSDLGLTRRNAQIHRACELWLKMFAKKDGGFGSERWKEGHLCTTGNMARALVKFGYGDHPEVKRAFDWMLKHRNKKGGWSCRAVDISRIGRTFDSWEPMSAFAALPKQKWSRGLKDAVESGAEFFLEGELHKQGARYEPWYRFHYPVHYYYDLLVALDFMTTLGYGLDPRLDYAVELLKTKRRSDGRWNLDAVHPDVEGGIGESYRKHPNNRPTPFSLEQPGEPSKMITLTAMRVLSRLNR
jgi:hypothetical protein